MFFKSGTYVAMKLTENSKRLINKYIDKNIPNLKKIDDLHVTLIYSKKPFSGDIELSSGMKHAISSGFTKFGENKEVLVMLLESKALERRHENLMKKHDFKYDFDKYNVHLSLSYDAKDVDISKLPKPNLILSFEKEYVEPLED